MADESFDNSNNLENLLSPFCYESETQLPKTSPEVPGGIYLSGFISQDCSWGCCFNQSVIKCFPVDKYFEESQNGMGNHSSNSSIAVSSSSYTFTGGRITCATELAIHNQRTSSGARKLLLGISYSSENNNKELRGAVVIFDPICCAPMKWIEIPDPVSSITVLSHFEEGGSSRPFFNETMMAMVGIAAVGLRGGSVIIVDLGLDDLNFSSLLGTKSITDVSYRLLYVNPHEYVIATKRHKAVSKRSLISLRFTNEPEDDVVSDAFHYCNPNGESILMLHKNSVGVTCIEYVPAIGSLLVGYTCGGFQIWRVNNMELQFSSDPVHFEKNIPVFGFSFQQPVDDPKNYCYVWVMFGNNSNECSSAHVELYCLYYENKAFIENFGFTYEGFRQCTRRMAIPLIDDFFPTDSEGEESSIRSSARPLRIWTQPDSELMCCAWEVGRGGIFYMGAFDLNQWYSNHTKDGIVYNPSTGLCPYWVALPVDIPDISNLVLDVRIIPKSLMRWENPHSKLDIHLYPASSSFRAVCLTNTGVSAFEHFGVQEKLVRIMFKDGPTLMIQPANLKNAFLRYGLEPIFPRVYGDSLSEKNRDRFLIFSVLLESRRTSAIVRLASAWLDGSFANVGCTIDLIIDWVGSYMMAIRSVADQHWESLLTFVDDTLPPETIDFVNCSNFAWTSLHKMLSTLMNPTEVYSARGLELEDIEFGLGKLVQYSAALLMLHKAKFFLQNDRMFITTMTEHYKIRREQSKRAIYGSNFIDIRYKNTHPLMIDHLMDSLMMEDEIKAEWHVSDGEYMYPPQHIGYLVNMFMWPDADPRTVSRVFMYFLFDLNLRYLEFANMTFNSDVERKIRGDFKAVLDCAADDYSDVLCLWLLDQGMYEDVMIHLKEKERLFETDGLPWWAAAVALTAAGYENEIADLLLKSCPVKLARLLFSLMTSSSSKYEALAELMVSSNLGSDEELLQQFFEISEERDRLGEFIRKRSKELPNRIRQTMLAFLNNSDSVKRMMQLLMYYVHTEQYQNLEEEFARVRNVLRLRNLSDSDNKLWTFQENYIVHVLNSTKESVVARFLRLQTPQYVRPKKSTICIKAVPVEPESLSPVPDSLRNESKLPPQLRRLRLSETYSSDPLSPLRRYAGKIQSIVSAAADSDDLLHENRKKRYSHSRKSFGRRTSRLSICGNTRSETTIINETVHEERHNESVSSKVDLISLLRTPAIDHRSENRKMDRSLNFSSSQRSSCATPDETLSQPLPVHSIMKEKDPLKPKVAKKMELRFENLSLHSSDDDDKNATIYEDADDAVGETSMNGSNLDVHRDSIANTSDVACPNTEDVIGSNESEAETSFFNALETADTSESEKIASHVEDVQYPSSLYQISEERLEDRDEGVYQIEDTKTEDVTSEPFEVSVAVAEDRVSPSKLLTTQATHATTEEVLMQVVETSSQFQAFHQVQIDLSDFGIPVEKATSKNDKEGEDALTGTDEPQIRLRTSKSRTPKRDMPILSQSETKRKSRSSRSSSTSSTPTKESTHESQEIQTKDIARKTGKSRSRTPKRELVDPSVDYKYKLPKRPQEDEDNIVVKEEPETKRIRRSSRTSRSTTPSREVMEEIPEESEATTPRRQTRLSRSRTPIRDPSVSSIFEVTVTETLPSTSRVVDQHRAAETDEEVEGTENKSVRRSARTSQSRTREIFEEEYFDDLETTIVRRSTRVSRSRTPSRDVQDESIGETDDNATRRTLRARRSTTPSRDAQEGNVEDVDMTSKKRVTRSKRSKTPLTDLYDAPEEPQTKPVRRSNRASKTPTREVEDSIQESPSKAVRRSGRSAQAKKAVSVFSDDGNDELNDEVDEDKADEISSKRKKNQKAEVPKKSQKRRLKYFEHQQELSTLLETEDSGADITASVLEATVLSSAPELRPGTSLQSRRIKGIKARPEETEPEIPIEKPTKRRKAISDDLLFELDSEVSTSTRSNRSTSSRKSTTSSKGKATRRKGRSASQSGS